MTYKEFFQNTVEGENFVKSLYQMIEREHAEAEKETDPRQSHAHIQRACGIRQVIAKISSISADFKKPTNIVANIEDVTDVMASRE